MDALLYFAETTLLLIVAVFCVTGALLRALFFVISFFFGRRPLKRNRFWHRLATHLGVFVPFHRAFLKKPVYAAIRYAFHASLFVVPIWFSGHINLWEESRFAWYWTPLPDVWADGMTLFVLAGSVFFLVRRVVFKNRLESKPSDILFILITGLPFLTGYLLTHGNLNSIAFFNEYLWHMHLISGEVMLATVIFLFLRTRRHEPACVGCTACVENCPTETLEYDDRDATRFFRYSHYQCICCGACVDVCPENAAALRHALGISYFFQILSKGTIGKAGLGTCEQCGAAIAPKSLLTKIESIMSANDIEMGVLNYCGRCRKLISRIKAGRI